ncbi:ABC transporter substrate-binding protein [Phenylobacterium sp.]|uniref:ABC transporter substrate-binding protein n=1 Tax=Phenylobacterium sp. TaxID=1871053 RepID=UPI0035B15DD2
MTARAWIGLAAVLAAAGCMPRVDPADRAQRLVFADAFGPVSLDPGFSATGAEAPIEAQLYEQLTAIDPQSSDARVVGELAKSWTVSPDGLAIDFRLRPGRVFSDGAPVDAAAVKFSFDRIKAIGRGPSGHLEWLDRVEVTGPLTLRLVLKRRYAAALQLLAHPAASVVNPAQVRAHAGADRGAAWLSAHSAGSGPYVLADIVPNDHVTIAANPRAQRPPVHFRSVEFRAIPDEGVRRLLLERGDVDMTDVISAAFVARYRALRGVAVDMRPGGPSLSFLVLNTRKGPLRDVRLRQAVAAAIDYRALREQVLKGAASQSAGYLTPGSPGYDADAPPPARDLERARALVKQAGYDGRPLKLLIGQLGPVAEFVQSNLAEAGISVHLERRSTAAIQALQASGDFDLVYTGWSLDAPDAAPMLEALFASRSIASGTNGSGYADALSDRLIDQAVGEDDPAKRGVLLAALDRRLRAERPIVMLFSANPVVAYRADIGGVVLDPYAPTLFTFSTMTRRSTTP